MQLCSGGFLRFSQVFSGSHLLGLDTKHMHALVLYTKRLEEMCHVIRHVPGSAVCVLAWLVMDSEGKTTGVNITLDLNML